MASVLITGASKGIGRAAAAEFAHRGHRVIATARDPLHVLRDLIQPWPTFSSIYADALKALQGSIAAARQPAGAGSP